MTKAHQVRVAVATVTTLTMIAAPLGGWCQSEPGNEKRFTIQLNRATVTDAIRELAAKSGLNVYTDVYRNDPSPAPLVLEAVTTHEAIARICQQYQRTAFVFGTTVVLRDYRWYLRVSQERFAIREWGPNWLNWKGAGKAIVSPASDQVATGKDHRVSARLVRAVFETTSVSSALAALARESGWIMAVSPDLANRRLSGFVHNALPSGIVEAITLLVNGGQRVSIAQTKEQREDEAELLAEYAEQKSEDQKASDRLLGELTESLSREQRAAIARGEEVAIPFDSLPANLKQKANDYIDLAARTRAGGFQLDNGRSGEFQLQIKPPPNTLIGVGAYLSNGTRIFF